MGSWFTSDIDGYKNLRPALLITLISIQLLLYTHWSSTGEGMYDIRWNCCGVQHTASLTYSQTMFEDSPAQLYYLATSALLTDNAVEVCMVGYRRETILVY